MRGWSLGPAIWGSSWQASCNRFESVHLGGACWRGFDGEVPRRCVRIPGLDSVKIESIS